MALSAIFYAARTKALAVVLEACTTGIKHTRALSCPLTPVARLPQTGQCAENTAANVALLPSLMQCGTAEQALPRLVPRVHNRASW